MEIELCAFSGHGLNKKNIDSSIRIELCSNFFEGGLTPSPATFLSVRKELKNQLFIMIRPRGGDFCYSKDEFELMKEEISWFKENGANGIVLGILKEDGSVDKSRTQALVKHSSPLPVTFHRAIDMSNNLNKALEDIIEAGCTRILSSGGEKDVDSGLESLINLHKQAGERIAIMPGGGVNISNVQQFISAGFKNMHLSSKRIIKSSMKYKADISMTSSTDISSYNYIGIDFEKLNRFRNYVQKNTSF